MKNYYLVFNGKNSIMYNLFQNLEENSNINIIKEPYTFKNDYFRRIFNKFNLRPRFLFRRQCNLSKYDYKDSIVVFDNESLSHISKRRLMRIKKQAKKIVLYFIDEFSNDYSSIKYAKKFFFEDVFDKVYTYSLNDSEKYDILLNYSYYHKYNFDTNNLISNDLFFIGNIKNRGQMITDLSLFLDDKNIKRLFYLACFESDLFKYIPIRKKLLYKDTIEKMLTCNCILDIVDSGSSGGVSLRFFEAVVYNKKLLTNNKNIVKMPFYNPNYMKIFEKYDDIDLDWLKNNENVDYGYNGEFEAIEFIKRIDKEIE